MIPPLEELARERVAALLGARSRVVGVAALASGDDGAVALVTLARPPRRLVLKVAGPRAAPAVDLERTAAASALARASRAPVAAVLAVGTVPGASGWGYLLQEHVEGVDWRGVRPLLDPQQLAAAHRQIATAVLAVQSARFAGFGGLGSGDAPAGADLGQALRRRAELRIADPRRRAVFGELLEREADLLRATGGPRPCATTICTTPTSSSGPSVGPGGSRGLEHLADTPRHRADTAALCRRLGLRQPK